MAETSTRYECQICGRSWTDPEEAKRCEARGRGPEYPVGCIHGDHESSLYRDVTFAVAASSADGHTSLGAFWVCRDNGFGDTLGPAVCGRCPIRLNRCFGRVNPESPTFKRMVAWLQSQDIPVTVWNGEFAEPLEAFLARCKGHGFFTAFPWTCGREAGVTKEV